MKTITLSLLTAFVAACTPADVIQSKAMAPETEAPETETPVAAWGIGSPTRMVTRNAGESDEFEENVFALLPENSFCLPTGINANAGLQTFETTFFYNGTMQYYVAAYPLSVALQLNTAHQNDMADRTRDYLSLQNMVENVDYELTVWQISGGGIKYVQVKIMNDELTYHGQCEDRY